MAFDFFKRQGKPTAQAAIDDLPSQMKRPLVAGLALLADVSKSKWDTLAVASIDAIGSSYIQSADELSASLGVPQEEAGHLANAASFIVALIGSFPDCSPSDLTAGLLESELIEERHRQPIGEFAAFVANQRGKLEEELDRSTLESEVLPSLQRFATVVDIRFDDRADGGVRTTPVLIGMIDTDAEGQIVWFQMSKRQLKNMLIQLQSALEKMDKAEVWARSQYKK